MFSTAVLKISEEQTAICETYGLTPALYELAVETYKLTTEDFDLIVKEKLTVAQYLETVEAHKVLLDKIPKVDAIADSQEYMLAKMIESFEKHKCVLVSGVYKKGPEGTCEAMSVYPEFIRFLRNKVAPVITEQVYIVYLGWKDSKPPHPKIVNKVRNGEFTIEKGGFIIPGYTEPAAVTTLVPTATQAKMLTYVMGSAASNFHKFMGAGVTMRDLGCKSIPQEMLDAEFTTAEQVIQGWKGFIAVLFPIFRREGKTEEEHAEARDNIMKATDCKAQKKAGRNVGLDFKRYGTTAGKISVRLFAAILAARIAFNDKELIEFMHVNRECDNEIFESAIHEPDAGFTGKFPDTTWGSTLGSPQVFLFPDQVKKANLKVEGVFGNGIAMYQAAARGDLAVLKMIGFTEPVTPDNADRFAAALFGAIWSDTCKDAEVVEAIVKAELMAAKEASA